MKVRQFAFFVQKKVDTIEWKLLVFLVLFMDVKLAVKLAAIVIAYLLQPNFRLGFSLKSPRLPLFYLSAIALALLNYFLGKNYTFNYTIVVLTGIVFWFVCILASHQVKLFTERTDIQKLHNTLLVFLVLNIAFSFLNLSAIFMEIGLRNPFRYQGQYQKYFMNTGDYIKGISFDTSTTNAFINCFGAVYFLYQKKYVWVLACMAALVLTASNLSNIILVIVLLAIFVLKSTKAQKSIIAVCIVFVIVFLVKISPQNDSYLAWTINTFLLKKDDKVGTQQKEIPIRERPDNLLTEATRKEKIATLFLDSLKRVDLEKTAIKTNNVAVVLANVQEEKPVIPQDSIHTATFQWKRDTTPLQQQLIAYVDSAPVKAVIMFDGKTPGKLQAFKQTYSYLKTHPSKAAFGAGVGDFSSKLAFKATGLNIAGGYPAKWVYCNPAFLNNHLALYTHFFTQTAQSHSVVHNPASVYDQLLAEYGLFGFIMFLLFYVVYFLKDIKKITYGLPLLALLLAAFMVDYWFEQLSIVVLFELMMFIDIKEQTQNISHEQH